jgi:hypothetical protein
VFFRSRTSLYGSVLHQHDGDKMWTVGDLELDGYGLWLYNDVDTLHVKIDNINDL